MKFKIILYSIIILIVINGCTGNGKESELKVLDKASDSLEDIYKELSSILDNVDKIERIYQGIDFNNEEKTELQQGVEEPPSGEESDNPQNQEDKNPEAKSSDSADDRESKDGFNEDSKDEKLKQTWENMDISLENIYLGWSDYESKGIKKGASKDRVVEIKESINKMTSAVEQRDILNIYEYASLSLLNLKPFFNLYKDDYRGEICDLKYSAYQYYIKAVSGDKKGAESAIASKEENINRIRTLMGDDEKKTDALEKINNQLQTLSLSLEEDSKRVYMLEKNTLIHNLEAL